MNIPIFHIAIPAWGRRCVDVAAQHVIPSVIAALDAVDFDLRCRFHVFTDEPATLRPLLDAEDVEWNPAPAGTAHGALTKAHRDTLAAASHGSIVALLNADIVVSREAFSVAAALLGDTVKVLASTGVRTLMQAEAPPIGAPAADVFAWAWRNRHPFMEDSVWGRGRTVMPTTLFFEKGDSVVCRCFHLHPFFVRVDRALSFRGTIDDDLIAGYRPNEVRVLADREVGFAEISPLSRNFPSSGGPITVADVVRFGKRFLPAHVRNFSHPIRICGDGPVDDAAWQAIERGLRR